MARALGPDQTARLQATSLEKPDEVSPTSFGRVDIYDLDELAARRVSPIPAGPKTDTRRARRSLPVAW